MKREWKCFHPESLIWKGLPEIRHSSLQPWEMGSSTVCVGFSATGRPGWPWMLWVSSTCRLSADEHKPRSFPHKYGMVCVKGLGGKVASLQQAWGCCSRTCQNECPCLAPPCCPGDPLPLFLQLLFFSFLFFFLRAPQFEWGLRRSGEDCAAHLHLRRYTDGHPGEPAGDGGCVPGQAAQVSPPSPPLPALPRGGTGENPCLKKPLPTAGGINCRDEGCLWPCVAPWQRHSHTGLSASPLGFTLWRWDHVSIHPLRY